MAGKPDLADCPSHSIWSEPQVAVPLAQNPPSAQSAVTWTKLAGETFLVRQNDTEPRVFDDIVLRAGAARRGRE